MHDKNFRPSPFEDVEMLRSPTISESASRMGTTVLPFLLLVLTLGVAPRGLALEEIVSPLEPADTSSPRATLESFPEMGVSAAAHLRW